MLWQWGMFVIPLSSRRNILTGRNLVPLAEELPAVHLLVRMHACGASHVTLWRSSVGRIAHSTLKIDHTHHISIAISQPIAVVGVWWLRSLRTSCPLVHLDRLSDEGPCNKLVLLISRRRWTILSSSRDPVRLIACVAGRRSGSGSISATHHHT